MVFHRKVDSDSGDTRNFAHSKDPKLEVPLPGSGEVPKGALPLWSAEKPGHGGAKNRDSKTFRFLLALYSGSLR